MPHNKEHDACDIENSDCFYCKQKKCFTMPKEIINAAKNGELVVFAGAGVSTENSKVFPYTLYTDVKSALKKNLNENSDFPTVMSAFVKEFSYNDLLRLIKERFDYINSFPELYRHATSFHRELAHIHFIREIITTNWDDYFEKECGATPIVTSEDFAFWDLSKRKVLKLHGSISSYGSIIATKKSYANKYKFLSDSKMSKALKELLSTKTIVFFGYSFNDEYTFNKIYDNLFSHEKTKRPKTYIVSPNKKNKVILDRFNATGIETDGTFFLEKLKQHLKDEGSIITNDVFDLVYDKLVEVRNINSQIGNGKLNLQKHPEVLYLASYQDGLIHAFEKILRTNNSGSYSCPCCVEKLAHSYVRAIPIKRKAKKYYDIAYIEGYKNGLLFLIFNNEIRQFMPLYYVYGYKNPINSMAEYLKISKNAEKIHKTSYEKAKKIISKLKNKDTVYHHTPYLF